MLYPVVAGVGERHALRTAAPAPIPALAWLAAGVGIAGQIAYPLCDASGRNVLTNATVVAFFVAMVAATTTQVGPRRGVGAALLGCILAWSVELIGLHTGFPFGRYRYTGVLRPELAGVPVIVPLAWTAMALAALTVGRRLGTGRLRTALLGGVALATWDVFLDPQMVAAGYWRWQSPQWTIPGVPGIPLSNFAGWLVAAVLLIALLDRVLRQDPPEIAKPRPFGGSTGVRVAATVYLWTYGSEVLAGIAFFHRPAVAVVGGVLMGTVALPYARSLLR